MNKYLSVTSLKFRPNVNTAMLCDIGGLHFLTLTFAETFAELKLQSKYLLKS